MKRGAHLGDADLRDTHLGDALCPLTRGADLRWADLRRADLRRADLRRADLRRADLRRADLRRANLKGANLEGAEMRGANLESVRGLEWAQAGNQYHMLGVKIGGEVMIFCGCRRFTLAQAEKHWRPGNYELWTEHTAAWGQARRAALAYIKSLLC